MYCDVKEDDDDDNGEDGADWQKAFFARLKKNRAALAEAYAEAEQVGKAKEAFYLAPRYRATNGTEQRTVPSNECARRTGWRSLRRSRRARQKRQVYSGEGHTCGCLHDPRSNTSHSES